MQWRRKERKEGKDKERVGHERGSKRIRDV